MLEARWMWDVGCGAYVGCGTWDAGSGMRAFRGETPSTVARLHSSVTANSEFRYNIIIVYFNVLLVEQKSEDAMS